MDTLEAMIIGLFSAVSLTALIAVVGAVVEKGIGLGRGVWEQSPYRSLAVGAVNAGFLAFLVFLCGVLSDGVHPVFILPALAVLLLATLLILYGLAALAMFIGQRLWPKAAPGKQMVTGAALISFAILTPFIGWFVLLPLIVFAAVGVSVLVLVKRGGGRRKE